MEDLSVLDGYKVSSLSAPGPGAAAVKATYLPSPIQLTRDLKHTLDQNWKDNDRSAVDLSAVLDLESHVLNSAIESTEFVNCEHLMSRLWIVVLESISGLKYCRKLDKFDCKSIYTLSTFISQILDNECVKIPDKIKESLESADLELSREGATSMMWKIIEKQKKDMIVSLWKVDHCKTVLRFDQVSIVIGFTNNLHI